MKSKKWLWVTLAVLLTLAGLVVVAGAAFRMGAMQSARLAQTENGVPLQVPPYGHMRGFGQNFQGQPGVQQGYGPGMMQEYGRRGFERRHGGFFSPIFGLIKLAVLIGLLWLVYKLARNSGWRLVKANAPSEEAKKE